MVLAATAVPVELRSPGQATWSLGILPSDVLANVLGYVAVGLALADLGTWPCRDRRPPSFRYSRRPLNSGWCIGIPRSWTSSQTWRAQQQARPSPGVGRFICRPLRSTAAESLIAALLAVMLGAGVWLTSGAALNPRGLTSPGRLEGHWPLNERGGRVAEDSSGNGLNGRFSREPKLVTSAAGPAIRFDDADDYVDLGHSSALRLAGSMTVSAWVNATSFRADDAAILSSRYDSNLGSGYQLDASAGRGPTDLRAQGRRRMRTTDSAFWRDADRRRHLVSRGRRLRR